MKRSSPLRTTGIRSSNPFDNLSVEQLAYIGAIAMLYNDLEAHIDEICGRCVLPSIHQREILSRINGVDGKIEIVKHAAREWGCDKDELASLGETLGEHGFQELKGLRDAVVHARMFDLGSSVARTRAKRGKVAEVLLAVDALKGLFDRLEEMRCELRGISDILRNKRRIRHDRLDDQDKARLAEDNRALWTQVHEHRSQRLSLPPAPEWPDDTLVFGRPDERSGRPKE